MRQASNDLSAFSEDGCGPVGDTLLGGHGWSREAATAEAQVRKEGWLWGGEVGGLGFRGATGCSMDWKLG